MRRSECSLCCWHNRQHKVLAIYVTAVTIALLSGRLGQWRFAFLSDHTDDELWIESASCGEKECTNLERFVSYYLFLPNDVASWEASLIIPRNNKLYLSFLNTYIYIYRLRRCSTNRKVAGSIPDGVNGIFHSHSPSDCTMSLGSTRPLTEMSTRSISWG